jgi:hypothetical protein
MVTSNSTVMRYNKKRYSYEKTSLHHKSNFSLDYVMLSLSKHLKRYLNKPFDKLSTGVLWIG